MMRAVWVGTTSDLSRLVRMYPDQAVFVLGGGNYRARFLGASERAMHRPAAFSIDLRASQ